jgi:hypothetical protein
VIARLALAGMTLLVACAPAASVRPTRAETARPSRAHVEVPLLGLTPSQAVEQVRRAFAAEGLTIASAANGVVMSEPVRVRSRLSVEVEKRYTGTLIVEERGVRIVLTGETRLAGGDERWSEMSSHDPSWPASDGYHGFLKVRRIAARLVGDRPPESD